MSYSTNEELKNNVKMIENTFTTDPTPDEFATERISFADKIVKADCSKYIDFSSVPDDETTPIVNLLSQYKSAEMALRRITGIKRRQNENDDILEWKYNYDELKQKVMDGSVEVELGDGTLVTKSLSKFENTARPDIRPSQGYDKYGEWVNNDDMERLRGKPSDTKYRY
jgi:hypothetical protein